MSFSAFNMFFSCSGPWNVQLDSVWFIEFSSGIWSLVLLDCGTACSVCIIFWDSKIEFWWNRSPFCTNAEIWNMLLVLRCRRMMLVGLLWFLLMVGSVGLLITIAVWNFGCIGLVVLSGLGSCRTHPVCLSVCQCASRVIFSEQFTCLYWTFSKATVSVWCRICLHRGAHMCAHRRRRDEILPLRKWDSERSRPRRLRRCRCRWGRPVPETAEPAGPGT